MLSKRLRDARGNALVPAILVMGILLAFGTASLALVEGDQSDSRRERERESSFQLAEGVLNAQIYRLSTRWPGAQSKLYPPECTAAVTDEDCPAGATLQANFSGPDYRRPTAWKVQVRDNAIDAAGTATNFYSESLVATNPSRDANGDNFLWVRAEAQVAGRKRVLVALVEAEKVSFNFPKATLVAGKFEVSNSGSKVMIDTNGINNEWPAPGDIIVRCNTTASGCAVWDSGKGQIEPAVIKSVPTQPKAVTPEALDLLRTKAQTEGNYWPQNGVQCPTSLQGINGPGGIVFVENAEGCTFNGNGIYNSPAQPGYFVMARGAATFNGTAEFHGVIYHANEAQSNSMLVKLAGDISVFGSIVIDGDGGLSAGSSKVNLVYNPNAFDGLQAFGTAGLVQNTFREIKGS
jgi:Tfp pilus assembly protein PilX